MNSSTRTQALKTPYLNRNDCQTADSVPQQHMNIAPWAPLLLSFNKCFTLQVSVPCWDDESLILILIPNRITHVAWISVCVCILTSTGELQLQQRCLDSGSLPLASTKRPTARHVVSVFVCVCKQDKRHLLLLSCHLPPSSHQPPPDQPMGMGLMANVRKTDSQGVPGAAITMSLHTHVHCTCAHSAYKHTKTGTQSFYIYFYHIL